MRTFNHAAHMQGVLQPDMLQRCLERATQKLKDVQFDTIAFQGMSGALFAPVLAREMNKYLLLVRKSGDNTHSYDRVEGYYASKQYIIVDDFTSTGDTIHRIHNEIRNSVPGTKCVGVYWYTTNEFSPDYFGDLSTAKTEETPTSEPICESFTGAASAGCPCSECVRSRREVVETSFLSGSDFTSAVFTRK